jgi:hypothetical protein
MTKQKCAALDAKREGSLLADNHRFPVTTQQISQKQQILMKQTFSGWEHGCQEQNAGLLVVGCRSIARNEGEQ